jgi:8-oxo-dGTP diphosphatase
MIKSNTTPRIGIALIMTYEGRLLIGRRKNKPMPQSWQLPGGWLHYSESPLQAVHRLQHKFYGLEFTSAELVSYTNNLFDDGLHSVSLYFQMACLNVADVDLQGNQDCSDWMWADWYDLPQPLFLPLQKLKQSDYEPFIRD